MDAAQLRMRRRRAIHRFVESANLRKFVHLFANICIVLHPVAVSDRTIAGLKSLILLAFWRVQRVSLSNGVMVAQRSLEPLVVVRIHVGQPSQCGVKVYATIARQRDAGRKRPRRPVLRSATEGGLRSSFPTGPFRLNPPRTSSPNRPSTDCGRSLLHPARR